MADTFALNSQLSPSSPLGTSSSLPFLHRAASSSTGRWFWCYKLDGGTERKLWLERSRCGQGVRQTATLQSAWDHMVDISLQSSRTLYCPSTSHTAHWRQRGGGGRFYPHFTGWCCQTRSRRPTFSGVPSRHNSTAITPIRHQAGRQRVGFSAFPLDVSVRSLILLAGSHSMCVTSTCDVLADMQIVSSLGPSKGLSS